MDDDYPEVEDSRSISPNKLRKLIKHLGAAVGTLKQEDKVKSRRDFLEKVEELSGEKLPPHEPDEGFSTIETKLRRLEEVDKATLQVQKQDEAEIVNLKESVHKEDVSIEEMRSKIILLEKRLQNSELRRIKQLKESKDKMLSLTHMLSDLNLKLGVAVKKDESVKKLSAMQDKRQLASLRKKLKVMEDKHKKMKRSKKHKKTDLDRVEKKIKSLKKIVS